MRSLMIFLGLLLLSFALAASVHAQGYGYGMGPGMMGGYGGYGMGPGMMGYGPGYGMGPGMMGGYGGYGMGPGMMGGYGYGRQSQVCSKFLDETQGLRKDLMNKRFEYSEALRDPKASEDMLSKLENEIDDLEGKIQSKNTKGCWW